MKLKLRSPHSGEIVEFNISHLISNKTLNFAKNDEVHCASGVYQFNRIEKLVYTEAASEKFDSDGIHLTYNRAPLAKHMAAI